MFANEWEKLFFGFSIGFLLSGALFITTLLILTVPYFWVLPLGGVVGYLLTKPKWISEIRKQKEYRE